MTRGTVCFYCGMSGAIITLDTPVPIDMHVHQCGTRMYLDSETGEVYDDKTRQSPGCIRIAELVVENDELRKANVVRIAERDGEIHDDDPY